MNDYKLFAKAKIEARALILHAVDETWVLELKEEDTIFMQVTPIQLLDRLQSICGGLHAIDVLALQNEMQEYHKYSKGILEYIKALKAVHKKSKRGTGNNPITDNTLLLIATNAMLKTGAHPRTTDKWEDLDAAAQTWNAWKMAYKTADMKDRVRQLATGENAAHGALHQTVDPKGTKMDDLVNKDDLEDYFDKIAAAATTAKVVLAQLTAAIAAMTINNEALVAPNSKLVAEVTTLTRRLVRNSGGAANTNTPTDKLTPRPALIAKKRDSTSLTHASNYPRMQADTRPIGKAACDMEGPLT